MTQPLKVVIVGGGTAGWMTAAAFGGVLARGQCDVQVISSEEILTIGVGEATLPQIREFNERIGINEAEFMSRTQASFKLGIEFVDWGKLGNRYHHPFGAFGQSMGGVNFHQCWRRAQAAGLDIPLESFSYPIVAAYNRKFEFPSKDVRSVKSTYAYAYHFDAFYYAEYLREFSELRGVRHIEGKIREVTLRPDDGYVASVTLESGQVIEGDLFIDCSGARALLISGALKTGFEDWSQWLPCDRAVATQCERSGPDGATTGYLETPDFTPFTRSTAREAGWQWRIPLQHRTGNGYVYSSAFLSDEAARQTLLTHLDGPPITEPRSLRFRTGRRDKGWNKNVVAVGLASGFLEPLESTSIYLIQVAVINLLRLLPRDGYMDPTIEAEFNRLIDLEYERIRDFLILHYHANTRDDAELWRYTRNMTIPDSLTERMDLFRHRGQVPAYYDGLFAPPSWISVFFGQGLWPEAHDPLADNIDLDQMMARMRELETQIRTNVDLMPTQAQFLSHSDYTGTRVREGAR